MRSSIRTYLLAFSAGVLIPVLIFASVLIWRFAGLEVTRYEQEARSAALRLMAAVDLELSKFQTAAEALATSPFLQAGDFEAFQRQALEALRVWSPEDPNRLAIVVRDLNGQQVANTRLPWGQPLPKGSNPDVDQVVAQTKMTAIQDLFVGATAGRPIVSIRVPVFKSGEVTHVLSMALQPERFAELARAQRLPEGWVGTLVDGADRVIARTRDQERFLGQFAPEEFRSARRGSGELWLGKNLDGVGVLGAYERSSFARWTAFVGVPRAIAERPLRYSLWGIAALGVVALGLSIILAVPFGGRIAASARSLADAAVRLGQGHIVRASVSGLREFDEVSEALFKASFELREREDALRASEGRLRATHENAGVGIVEVDRDGRFLYVNEAQSRLTGHTREELLGRHFTHATHADDLDRDYELFQRQVAGEFGIYTIEKQHVRIDGTTGWAKVSSTAVRDQKGEFLYAVRVVEDITEQKQAEARQRLLVDELNHRVKNTLATVQSLAYQTFRQALPPEVARERFEARLLALSRTHNLLNESHWQGAPLTEVLALELEPYVGENRQRLSLAGPTIDLSARIAVVLGMVFHELATNAVKHGALSTPLGTVSIEWSVQVEGPGPILVLIWSERMGPVVNEPTRRGFGTRLIDSAVTRELAGRASVTYAPTGVRVELHIPLPQDSGVQVAA